MSYNLLPCPFCGAGARLEKRATGCVVMCDQRHCDCQMNMRTHHFDTPEKAIAAWNTRPPTNGKPTPAEDAVEAAAIVTQDDALKFLGCACRNWAQVNFDSEDLEDFRIELERFARATLQQANGNNGRDGLREALQGAHSVSSGPDGKGGMRVLIHFHEAPQEARLFSLLNAHLNATQPAPDHSALVEEDWQRSGTLVYCLKPDGWRKGKEVMVNKYWLRVEADRNEPEGAAEELAETILSALKEQQR